MQVGVAINRKGKRKKRLGARPTPFLTILVIKNKQYYIFGWKTQSRYTRDNYAFRLVRLPPEQSPMESKKKELVAHRWGKVTDHIASWESVPAPGKNDISICIIYSPQLTLPTQPDLDMRFEATLATSKKKRRRKAWQGRLEPDRWFRHRLFFEFRHMRSPATYWKAQSRLVTWQFVEIVVSISILHTFVGVTPVPVYYINTCIHVVVSTDVTHSWYFNQSVYGMA